MKASLARICALLCLGAAVARADDAPPAARVQREAENPMRWIVEAGRLKSRAKPAEAAASAARVAADKPLLRSAASKPAIPTALAVPLGTAPVEPDPAAIALAENETPPAAVAPVRLETLERIEGEDPALPDAIKRQLQADGEVLLDFTVQPDGSVAELEVLSSSDNRLEPIVLEAVRGWRYKPIALARRQRVQIAFSARD